MIPAADARRAIDMAGQGTSTAGIARALGHDRRTIRTYLSGHRAPGQPRASTDAFATFTAYIRQRTRDDIHLIRSGLHREIAALGYTGSYPAFTRELRHHGIVPGCASCGSRASHMPSPPPLPQLPVRVAPVAGETISSYLARIAAAVHLPADGIAGCLPPWFASRASACDDLGGTRRPLPRDTALLAALTGIGENALQQALPALGTGYGEPRPPVRAGLACRLCAARHGHREPIPVHYPAHERACRRHRTWLGCIIQIDITAAPDITAASREASRLAREHGITRLVLAETTARQHTIGGPDARRRAAALALASPGLDPGHPDTAEAAAYPETVTAAAALLRAPGALPGGPE